MLSEGQVGYAEAKDMSPDDLTSSILFFSALNKAKADSDNGSVDIGKIWDDINKM